MDRLNIENHNPSSTTSSSSSSFHNQKVIKTRNTKRSTSTLSIDPQSVAARERRHRISDRFKILQSMVPGGSKMDTVSMLDEAIRYVKFLKAQIWFHQNMLQLVNNHETTYYNSSPDVVGDFGPRHFGSGGDDYTPVVETYSQGMPFKVTDSEYSMWFGSVDDDDQQEESMHHRRGLF